MPHTARLRPAATSLVALLRDRASNDGDAVSHRFLQDGAAVTASLTYADLDRRARAAAVVLGRHAAAGDRVLLLYPPGLEFLVGFFGSLYANLIPVPAYPLRPQQIDERVSAIAADAQPAVALSTDEIAGRSGGTVSVGGAGAALSCLSVDLVPPGAAEEWRPATVDGGSVAHLQYTSGSTASPKGVMVTHANILANLDDMDRGWRHDASSTIVSWLPAFHDMGLIYGLLASIYACIPCVLMPPVVFLQRPVRWLQAIQRFRGTHAAAPNFAYDHCVRRVKDEDRAALDLSSWRVAVNGAEPVRADTIDRFCATFASAGFERRAFAPGFGLAEATLKVTAMQAGEGPLVSWFSGTALERGEAVDAPAGTADARSLVACGTPIAETRVAIVDASTMARLPDGRVGEIWVGGPSVAAGYWQRPAESSQTFAARTANGDGPFMRTGDLGLMHGGHLYVAGRIKDLVIIRGQNYYPQDIEQTMEGSGAQARPGAAAAFSIERDGEERLVVARELERGVKPADRPAQIELIRAAIAGEHELNAFDVVLLRIGAIPRTSSGKIQRRACRAAYLDGTLERLDAEGRA